MEMLTTVSMDSAVLENNSILHSVVNPNQIHDMNDML